MTARDCSLLARGTYVFSSGFSLHVMSSMYYYVLSKEWRMECNLNGIYNIRNGRKYDLTNIQN